MKIDEFLNKEYIHKDLGKVLVTGKVKGSRTKVEIKVTQRAKGWCDETNSYKMVRTIRGNEGMVGSSIHYKMYNDSHSQFGFEDICHKKGLTEII